MSWIKSRPRLEQVYVFTTAKLNDCGIRPDNAVIKPWIRDELEKIDPVPTKFEVEMVLVGMVAEGAKLYGEPDSALRFAAEPMFAGSVLGKMS
jgi:hypothetical protein